MEGLLCIVANSFASLLFACCCSSALAFEGIGVEGFEVDVTAGYRSDQLEWSIAGDRDGRNPNILSELTWENIDILQLTGQAKIETGSIPYFDKKSLFLARFSIGKIVDGDVRDSDYAGNNRTEE